MKFVGQLFLRKLLSQKIVRGIIHSLIEGMEYPPEHFIECVCVLLKNIGSTLEGSRSGREQLSTFIDRLKNLANLKSKGGRGKYSRRRRGRFILIPCPQSFRKMDFLGVWFPAIGDKHRPRVFAEAWPRLLKHLARISANPQLFPFHSTMTNDASRCTYNPHIFHAMARHIFHRLHPGPPPPGEIGLLTGQSA